MNYKMIYSGPLLFKTKININDLVKINSLCFKDKKLDHRKHLAGIINQEYLIEDKKSLVSILQPYLDFFYDAYFSWYGHKYKSIELNTAWINYMKAGECNPMHIHTSCDFSSVFYLDIPKGLKKESKEYVNNGSKPGSIYFHLYPSIDHHISQYSCLPEVGDFFIFPARLFHSVNSFKSKGERVSIACNFNIK